MSSNLYPKILIFFFVVSTILAVPPLMAGDEDQVIRVVEDFSRFKAGAFPEGWKCRWGQKSKAKKIYTVRTSSEGYLEAKAINSDVPIAKKFQYDLKEYPFLSWQWRVLELPEGGDERHKKTGDSGAGIYVIFPGLLRPENIKYVWSASVPEGTTTDSPYNSKTKIVVLRNQSTSLEIWVSEKVNVYEDYKRLFSQEPQTVQGIGIMSDSNDTKSRAEAYYRKICISKK
ncbi:MAG: DUF3047 domain-containing protein [Proteobacteria bacterium]|nr:DUF3047 domain-containing protein [Pseudomonadota bacterium]